MTIRPYFHVPENYFLSHSVGCLPKRTEECVASSFFGPWANGNNWADWMPLLEEFRAGLAHLLGALPANFCPQVNISSALTKIIHSLPPQAGKNIIVLSKQDFPTIGFVLKQAERRGYALRFVEGDPTNITHWENAVRGDTAIVHITHALSNTSHLLPVKEICALAKITGALSIVDIAQSIGAIDVPLNDWDCDFAIGTGVKFLCAGPGACFLFASNAMLSHCKPIDVGWFSHENPFEMDINEFRFAKDAMRFFGGTPSPAPIAAANAALSLWKEIGLETAHITIQVHLAAIVQSIPPHLLISPSERNKRGASCVIAPENRAPLRKALDRHQIRYDERQEGFRFSVHGYTSTTEINNLTKILTTTLG